MKKQTIPTPQCRTPGRQKIVWSLLFITGLIASSGGLSAFADVSGDYEYINNGDSTATIINYTAYGTTNLVIPAVLDSCDVIEIADSAFRSKGLVGSLTLPDSVVTMGTEAFRSNYGLTNLWLGSRITNIGEKAFYVTKLKALTLPDSVITIGDDAFYHNNIETLTISTNVTSIGARAFMNNRRLTTLVIPDRVATIGVRAFYDNDIDTLTLGSGIISIEEEAFTANNLTNGVILPDGLTTLGDYAFYRSGLTGITIPTTLLNMGYGVFNNNAITMINGIASDGIIYARNPDGSDNTGAIISYGGNTGGSISNSVTTIGAHAFARNTIYSMTLPDTVTTIEESAFWSCGLSIIKTGNGVTSIGANAFLGNNLTNVTIGTRVVTIGEAAFKNNDIPALSIPNSVTAIGKEAFLGNRICTLTLGNQVTAIGLSAFMANYISSIIIPDSVTNIAGNAFYTQENYPVFTVTNLTLGANVRYIGAWSFRKTGFDEITLPASPVWGDYCFSGWMFGGNPVVDSNPEEEGVQALTDVFYPYEARYDAQTPGILQDLTSKNTTVGTAVELDATAAVSDGGNISYQWYSTDNTSNSNPSVISGETNATYSVPVVAQGIFYCYCRITNTNNGVNGSVTAAIDSAISTVTVDTSGAFNDWAVAEGVPFGLRGELDDPAGDGIASIWKYAHGLPAMTPVSSQDLLTSEIRPGAPVRFIVTYQKSKSAQNIALFPVWTDRLGADSMWQTSGFQINKISETDELETWEASIPVDTQSGYIRLRLNY